MISKLSWMAPATVLLLAACGGSESNADDYAAANQLDPEDLGDIVCLHCHQSAEKYLKALITLHGGEPKSTHDLIDLIESLPGGGGLSEEAIDAVDMLDGFAVTVRYPTEDPDMEDVAEALRAAHLVRESARRALDLIQDDV